MILCTTRLTPKQLELLNGQKLLYLGNWCAPNPLTPDKPCLPSIWDEGVNLSDIYPELRKLTESLLLSLGPALNKIHGVSFDKEQWAVFFGMWAESAVFILFDRWKSLREAAANSGISGIVVPSLDSEIPVPRNFFEFLRWYSEDSANFYLFRDVVVAMAVNWKLVEVPVVPIAPLWQREYMINPSFKRWPVNIGFDLLAKFTKVRILETYLSLKQQVALQVGIGKIPSFSFIKDHTQDPKRVPCSVELRRRVSVSLSEWQPSTSFPPEFVKVLKALIPKMLPQALLEEFMDGFRAQEKSAPAKLVIAGASVHMNEGVKHYLARHKKSGQKTVLEQHGGHYGIGAVSAFEDVESSIADAYFSWGWRDEKRPQIRPVGSAKLSRLPRKIKSRADGALLMVGGFVPRYAYWGYSLPLGAQFARHIQEQLDFLSLLEPSLRSKIIYRSHKNSSGWNEEALLKSIGVKVSYDEPIATELAKSRLFIGTYNATTYLETFATDFPSLLFWDPKLWPIRSSAQSFFSALEAAKVFHSTPKSAAAHLTAIVGDPEKWWRSAQVQDAVQTFAAVYAKRSGDGMGEWIKELSKQKTAVEFL